MTNTCLYHPTQQAHFECHECQTSYCPKCISKRSYAKFAQARAATAYFCPKCNLPVTPLTIGNIVKPFWKRLPHFFAYPFKLQPLLLIVVLSLVGLIFHNSTLVNLLLWAVLVKYAYAVLLQTSQGKLEPPNLSAELVLDNFFQVFKQFILFVILGGGGFVAAEFWGPLVLVPYGLACVIFMPAMLIILVTHDNFVSALNPQYTVTLVGKVGGRYFQLLLFLFLLLSAPAALAGAARFLPEALQYFVQILAQNYYTIVAYNLMGYVLLQYHEELGYEVAYEDFQDQKSLGKEVAKGPYADLIAEVNVYTAEGMLNEAINKIEQVTRREITELELSSRYYELLKTTERLAEMAYYGVNHLELLGKKGEITTACRVYKECLAQAPDFCPSSRTLYKIAGWLVQAGEPRLAVNAYAKFIKANAENHLVPEAYFHIARILIDKLGDKAKARGVLQTLLSKYPAHQISMDARQRLEQIAS